MRISYNTKANKIIELFQNKTDHLNTVGRFKEFELNDYTDNSVSLYIASTEIIIKLKEEEEGKTNVLIGHKHMSADENAILMSGPIIDGYKGQILEFINQSLDATEVPESARLHAKNIQRKSIQGFWKVILMVAAFFIFLYFLFVLFV